MKTCNRWREGDMNIHAEGGFEVGWVFEVMQDGQHRDMGPARPQISGLTCFKKWGGAIKHS